MAGLLQTGGKKLHLVTEKTGPPAKTALARLERFAIETGKTGTSGMAGQNFLRARSDGKKRRQFMRRPRCL